MEHQQQMRHHQQAAIPTIKESINIRQEHPHLPVQAFWAVLVVVGAGTFIAVFIFFAYVISSWHAFLTQLPGWMAAATGLISLAGVAILVWLIIKVVRAGLETLTAFWQGLAHGWEIFQRGQNIRAEAQVKRYLLHAAPNYAVTRQNNQVFVVPVQTEKFNYNIKVPQLGEGTTVESLPSSTEIVKPTLEEIVNYVKHNSYEFVLGRSLQTREFITVELVDAHIKIVGGSRMGKSCEAGALIDQFRRTHDRAHLQIAMLDLENKTSRLFENDEHIILHARSVEEVAHAIIHLHEVMKQRYAILDEEEVDRLPRILIYFEEFLYWKKLLGQFVPEEIREKSLTSFDGLATRGLKVGLHLMICAQVNYADEELRDAMAQFLAINVSFSVKPSAAQAAGFVDTDLLNRNYKARQPGQFVVETIGGSDIGVAPDYNVKAKLKQGKARASFSEDTEGIQSVPAVSDEDEMPENFQREGPVTGTLESAVNPLEKMAENIPRFSESEELQVLQIARVHLATFGKVIRSKIPEAMEPRRNNQFYPVVKYICDREGW